MLAVGAPAAPADVGVAVIIGNKDYVDERVPEVAYAHRDADAFRRYVVDVLGFDEANVIDLRDATQAEMETAFGNDRDHKGKLWSYLDPEGSDVVVYYSGHGVPGVEDRKGYLLPADANPDTAHLNGYPIERLYANLGKLSEATSVRVFLDACFSGASQGGMLIDAASPVFVSANLPELADKAMAVLTAASGDQIASWDKHAGHGLFTHHLLDALYGGGDTDDDGRVTATEAKRYLDRHMTLAARRSYLRNQQAGMHGDGSMVLAFAPRGGFPQRPTVPGASPRTWPFTVETEPAGARVRIMNIEERYRPGIELPAGEYRVEATLDGHDTVEQMVRHAAGPTTERVVLHRSVVSRPVEERFRDCPDCPEMVVIPAGRFEMGCDVDDCEDDEKPVHPVRIPDDFALGRYEVTVGEFRRFVEETGHRTDAERDAGRGCFTKDMDRDEWDWTPGRSLRNLQYTVRDRQPVTCVSWNDAEAYVVWLGKRTGTPYRLPSEAEWEYAARVGTRTRYHFGDAPERLCDYGNVADNTKLPNGNVWTKRADCKDGAAYPSAVGSYRPNAFGLHDMHGNVWEWAEDCWNDTYAGAPADGSAWLSGNCARRVLRGGSWGDTPRYLRAAVRDQGSTSYRADYIGFRVARTLAP